MDVLAIHFDDLQTIIDVEQVVGVDLLRTAQQGGFGAALYLGFGGGDEEGVRVKLGELTGLVSSQVDEVKLLVRGGGLGLE